MYPGHRAASESEVMIKSFYAKDYGPSELKISCKREIRNWHEEIVSKKLLAYKDFSVGDLILKVLFVAVLFLSNLNHLGNSNNQLCSLFHGIFLFCITPPNSLPIYVS